MKNRLFIVCPFSNLELFINKKYGNNAYFISVPGAVVLFEDLDYLIAIKRFLEENKIDSIYVVADVSCPFINKITDRNNDISNYWEYAIEEIYNENYLEHFENLSIQEQKFKLAAMNVNNLANEIMESEIFKDLINTNKIHLRGLITSRIQNHLEEINIHQLNRNSFEF
jgi:carbonic anhydrase